MPGGNPVTDVPALTPRFPEIVDGPVLVTVEPARTAKCSAVPSGAIPAWARAAAQARRPVSASAAYFDRVVRARRAEAVVAVKMAFSR